MEAKSTLDKAKEFFDTKGKTKGIKSRHSAAVLMAEFAEDFVKADAQSRYDEAMKYADAILDTVGMVGEDVVEQTACIAAGIKNKEE